MATTTITTCARCGVEARYGMTSPIGVVCPDCYDLVADGDNGAIRMSDTERGVKLSADGRTFIVAIRYEDYDLRMTVKDLGFRWNHTEKVWTKAVANNIEAGKLARTLVTKRLPILDDRVMIATSFVAAAPDAAEVKTRDVTFELENAPKQGHGGQLQSVTVAIPAETPTDLQSELRAAGPQIAAAIAKTGHFTSPVKYDSAYVWPNTQYAGLNITIGRKTEYQVHVRVA